ncbi:zinc-binding dehydrogenase [Microbacterium sp. cf046]|nr:zinc-binding dehydrogenase [Microbacterium sp. cf046]
MTDCVAPAVPPVIERIFPLAEARDALAHVEAGDTVGRVVVAVA